MLNISFLACTKVELWDLKICIAVNGENFKASVAMLKILFIWSDEFTY